MSRAAFTRGPILKHILTMTFSSAIGLVALFLVDLVDIYFLSLLGEQELAAAVGFSGTILFFLTSIGIGLSIGMGALVSQALGAGEDSLARRHCVHNLVISAVILTTLSGLIGWNLSDLLTFLGAEGRTHELAIRYSLILLPASPFLGIAICLASALRACGDAKRSMYATLSGGAVNAILDPILIFGLGWGIDGAAWATFIARMVIFVIAAYHLQTRHQLIGTPQLSELMNDARRFFSVSVPACLTSLSTPIGNTYVLYVMADFGDSAVAGAAIIGRIVPVAFGVLFALSGAIGPIVGQNLGARQFDRLRQTVIQAVAFVACYVVVVSLVLMLCSDFIVRAFDAQDEAKMLLYAYCHGISLLFFFTGMLFVANATFNNIHRAPLATLFNFLKSLLGTIPLVSLFALWFGPVGVIVGDLGGAMVWGGVAFWVALRQIRRLEEGILRP